MNKVFFIVLGMLQLMLRSQIKNMLADYTSYNGKKVVICEQIIICE